jgi:hypothetical protein
MEEADSWQERTAHVRQYVEEEFSPERRIGELEIMLKGILG